MRMRHVRSNLPLSRIINTGTIAIGMFLGITSCSSSSTTSSLPLTAPESLRNTNAIEYSEIFAEVIVNNNPPQTFSFTADLARQVNITGVQLDANNDVSIVWYQTFEGTPVELARQEGRFFGDSSTRTAAIDFPYDYSADSDADGQTNITEVIGGTCPLPSCNTDNQSGTEQTLTAPEMVAIPAGSFLMGTDDPAAPANEGPQHRVTLSAFKLAEAEVTWNDWALCVSDGGCTPVTEPDWLIDIPDKGQHALGGVTWDQIQDYLDWINTTLSANYRLPSEAEFEYALRAGTTTTFFFGDEDTNFCDFANGYNDDTTCQDGYPRSSPVKSFSPNPFGLYDMNGNAGEWTADCKHDNYIGAPANGEAWLGSETECKEGVMRGGNHIFIYSDFRVTDRRLKTRHRDFAEVHEGFRLASD